MRIALISDIHSNIAALDAVLEDITCRGVDQTVNLGDSLSGPCDARATADRLMGLDLPTVSGNHDRLLLDPKSSMGTWELWAVDALNAEHLDWLRALPKTVTVGDVFCCHATPESDAENWLDHRGPDDRLIARDHGGVAKRLAGIGAAVVACGHTHTPRAIRLPDGPFVVNPGSVGCPAYLDTRMEPNFVHQTGSPDARYAIVEKRGSEWTAMLISVPYDATEMARRARENGSESWARALETGWLA